MIYVAFICTANMCRSVMAHAICVHELAQHRWRAGVFSGGTMNLGGAAPAELAYATCKRHGTPVKKDTATFIRDLPLPAIDHFLVMTHAHYDCLVEDHQIPPERVLMLGSFDPEPGEVEIDDPVNQGPMQFEHCYVRLQRCIQRYLETTTAISGG